jgi:hypothetical protein
MIDQIQAQSDSRGNEPFSEFDKPGEFVLSGKIRSLGFGVAAVVCRGTFRSARFAINRFQIGYAAAGTRVEKSA